MKEEKVSDIEEQEDDTKCKQKYRGKKRKRKASDSSSDDEAILPENALEVEKNLHASAIKNNLDDVSVKKILKKVVTNDHVLALVKLREEEEESNTEEKLLPKLTRAKAKELMKASPQSAPWNLELTPIKHIPVKTRPEVKALIAQELPDDEDDDEYHPTHDDVPSDDDHVLESSSDLDSLPRTPATPRGQRKTTPKVVKDGPFKIPQEDVTAVRKKLDLKEEEATIALRTRSKLSLSSTPIEHIESSFVPPDDLPMADVDSLWNEFLTECLNPGPSTRNEDDDEADPEYNVAADPDANDADEEALDNNIIKISKKELNDLVAELFSIIPKDPTEEVTDKMVQDVLSEHHQPQQATVSRWEGKQEPPSDDEYHVNRISFDPTSVTKRDGVLRFSIGKSEPPDALEEDQAQNGLNEDRNENNSTSEANDLLGDPPDLSKVKEPCGDRSKSPSPEQTEASTADQLPDRSRNQSPKRTPISLERSKTQVGDDEPPALLRSLLKHNPPLVCIPIEKAQILPEQVLLLQQQLRQHVQLAACNYLQLYVHPLYWERARIYKDFLISLNKMTESNPGSVVNVCNLHPAMELIISWEKSFSEDTPQNLEMVKFINKELERSRRRARNNVLYMGNFPAMFMQVVANSPVFLYPYLLPATPYRDEGVRRRASFVRAVDQLLVSGLDQFWKYVEANPELYKQQGSSVLAPPCGYGLTTVMALVSTHMLPWIQPRSLLCHINHVRRKADRDNPIKKYFATGKVEPVKHQLLPYNPNLTLYEQPEHEVPRIWTRFLAKNSQRFRSYYHRRTEVSGQPPHGVDYQFQDNSKRLEVPSKLGLPIKFTKNKMNPSVNIVQNPRGDRPDNNSDAAQNATQSPLVATKIYTMISTSNGNLLLPLEVQTKTIMSTDTPICTPIQRDTTVNCTNQTTGITQINVTMTEDLIEGTKTAEINTPHVANRNVTEDTARAEETTSETGHCSCCSLLRKICNSRQTTILEYFKKSDSPRQKLCCSGREYPKITNRLKHLLKYYKIQSHNVYCDLRSKVVAAEGELKCITGNKENEENVLITDDTEEDAAIAQAFYMKLSVRSAMVRNLQAKKRVHALFAKFDVDGSDAVAAASELSHISDVELVDIYKEFLGFLTAYQADQMNKFKDYFVHRCLSRLASKIEEEVREPGRRLALLRQVGGVLCDGASSACQLCSGLLAHMRGLPRLAAYTFALFPHRHGRSTEEKDTHPKNVNNQQKPSEQRESETPMDYEADHSSSEEESEVRNEEETRPDDEAAMKKETEINTLQVTNITMTNNDPEDSDSSTMSMLIMSEDESTLRNETEWKRDEDKLILELLKEHIAPEERKDKTIFEIIEENKVLTIITQNLSHKSTEDVKERILYLLQLLVAND